MNAEHLVNHGWIQNGHLWSIHRIPAGLFTTGSFKNLSEKDAMEVQQCFDDLLKRKAERDASLPGTLEVAV
jgi:hypothetical protein